MTQWNKIDENLNLFKHITKIMTYLTKFNENWDQKGILTYKLFQVIIENINKLF